MKKILFSLVICVQGATASSQNLPWILPPSKDYTAVEPFSEGFAAVQKGTRWHYLDKKGKLSTDHYEKASAYSNGLGAVFTGNYWGFRNLEGILVGNPYEMAFDFEDNVAVVQSRQNRKWGIINTSDSLVVGFKYDALRPFANQRTGAKKRNNTLIINSFGIEFQANYSFIHTFSEGLALVTTRQGDWAYMDTTGHLKIPVKKGRKAASHFRDGRAAVWDNATDLSFIDATGKVVFTLTNAINHSKNINRPYNIFQHQFQEGFAAIQQQGKWGYVDTMGHVTIPCKYDAVTPFSEGFAAVKQGQEWFFIYPNGELVFKIGFLAAKPCTEGVAWVQMNAGWGLLGVAAQLNIICESPFQSEQPNVKVDFKSTRFLTQIQLERNGKWIKTIDCVAQNTFHHSENLLLDTGKTVLKWTAWAGRSMQSHESIFYYQPQAPEKIPYYGLLIANSQYDVSDFGNLQGKPIEDAARLAMILHEKYQFNQIEVLQNATLEQIETTCAALKGRAQIAERILIFYAGHGKKDAQQAYFIPTDATPKNKSSYFSQTAFTQYLSKLASEHILLITDACFAGNFIEPPPTRGGKSNTIESDTAIISENLKSREVMTSGQAVEVPNASLFIKHLFDALLQNTETLLPADKLFYALKPHVLNDFDNQNRKLVPQFGKLHYTGHAGGDFVFRRL
jgi:hypothetical protein